MLGSLLINLCYSFCCWNISVIFVDFLSSDYLLDFAELFLAGSFLPSVSTNSLRVFNSSWPRAMVIRLSGIASFGFWSLLASERVR